MELTNDEKKIILLQHIKNVKTNIFNLEVSLATELAVDPQDADIINNLNTQIARQNAKKDALLSQYAALNTGE